jgi:hypothetical protein
MPQAQPGTPVSIPDFVPFVLWPALILWMVFLVHRRRSGGWPCDWRFGVSLIPACLLTDLAALILALRWPYPESNPFVFSVLWLAAILSLTTYFALRTPGDSEGGDDPPEPGPPEPPWWPDFERDLRDYMRRRPRDPAKPPRAPAGIR